jgi:hypothetical protein
LRSGLDHFGGGGVYDFTVWHYKGITTRFYTVLSMSLNNGVGGVDFEVNKPVPPLGIEFFFNINQTTA